MPNDSFAFRSGTTRFRQYLDETGLRSPEVVLLNPPLDRYPGGECALYKTLPPMGLGLLATITASNGIPVAILDAEAMRLSTAEIAAILDDLSPKVIGVSMTSPAVDVLHEILDKVDPAPVVVAGGVHATVLPDRTLRDLPRVEAVFLGYAEAAWTEFCHRYRSTHAKSFSPFVFDGIPGVLTRGAKASSPTRDSLPQWDSAFVDRRFFINDPYRLSNGTYVSALLSSRGCPFDCEYCAASAFAGHRVRSRPIADLVCEIRKLVASGVTTFHFMDDTFTLSSDRIAEFRAMLEERSLRIRWKAFTRTEGITERAIVDMRRSGCYQLTFGVESGSNEVLAMMGKRQTRADYSRAVALCRSQGIKTKGFFMLGYPGESIVQMRQSCDFAIELELDTAFFYVVRAFPGTVLFDRLRGQGFSEEDLLAYQHVWPEMPNARLSPEQRQIRRDLQERGVFDLSKTLKYNICHKKSISSYSIDELCEVMADCYIRFYFRTRDGSNES